MSWSSVALYTFTGTFTSPKEIEPFQMERIKPVCPYRHPNKRLTCRLPTVHIPRFDATCPLDFDRPTGLAIKFTTDKVEGIAGDLDDAALAVRLHAAGHIHRLAPQVVDEFPAADDAGDHRAGVNADAKDESPPAESSFADLRLHVEREVDQSLGVINARARHTCRDHVAVAYRLDLLHVVLVDEIVEALEYVIEQVDQGQRHHGRRHRGEFDDVGEQDAGLVVVGGDRARLRLQGLGDLLRQDVEQQHLRAFLEEIAAADEVMQQPECDRNHRSEVEYEEPRHERVGQLCRRQMGLQQGSDRQQRDEADDPKQRPLGLFERQ